MRAGWHAFPETAAGQESAPSHRESMEALVNACFPGESRRRKRPRLVSGKACRPPSLSESTGHGSCCHRTLEMANFYLLHPLLSLVTIKPHGTLITVDAQITHCC